MISMRNTQSKFPRSSPVTGSLEGGRNSATRIFPARMFSGQRCRVTISIYGASPLHRLVRSTWRQAYATMLKKAMTSDAVMLVRNIDKAPYHLGSDAQPELNDTSGDSLHSRNRGQKEAQKPRQHAPALALCGRLAHERVETG